MIDPSDVLIIMMMFLVIAGFNFLRSFIERSEWGRSTSLNLKNIIFAPVYFIIAIVTALIMGVPVDLTLLLVLGGVFLTVFLIMNVIVYFAAKKRTDLMNDALDQFKKEHWGNEEE
jgi:Mn2+/Fe2+ NRAMP family transporter